jgi:hypothetical protein
MEHTKSDMGFLAICKLVLLLAIISQAGCKGKDDSTAGPTAAATNTIPPTTVAAEKVAPNAPASAPAPAAVQPDDSNKPSMQETEDYITQRIQGGHWNLSGTEVQVLSCTIDQAQRLSAQIKYTGPNDEIGFTLTLTAPLKNFDKSKLLVGEQHPYMLTLNMKASVSIDIQVNEKHGPPGAGLRIPPDSMEFAFQDKDIATRTMRAFVRLIELAEQKDKADPFAK